MNNIIKRIGQGIVIAGLSFGLLSCGTMPRTNDNILSRNDILRPSEWEYLKKIDSGLEGKALVLENQKGLVLLSIGDEYQIKVCEGVNEIHDDNVDIVEITKGSRILRVEQNIDYLPMFWKGIEKISPESQKMWNDIYNRLVDKNSKHSYMIILNR